MHQCYVIKAQDLSNIALPWEEPLFTHQYFGVPLAKLVSFSWPKLEEGFSVSS